MTAVIDGVRAGGYTPGMERTIDIHLRLSYDFRSVKPWLVLAFLALPAGDLASESVTLTTYYPAPSGVYTQMITTNNTYLARDGGNVGVGTVSPGQKLDVTGNIQASGEVIGTLASGSGQFRAISGNYGAFIRNDGADTYIPLLTASGSQYGSWNTLRPLRVNDATGDVYLANSQVYFRHSTGDAAINGNVGIGGTVPNATGRGYLLIDNTRTSCTQLDVTQGPVCGVGQYATFQPGLYVKGWSYANRGGTAYALTDATHQVTYEVWSNIGAGVGQWATLHQNPASAGSSWTDVASAHIWCCPE